MAKPLAPHSESGTVLAQFAIFMAIIGVVAVVALSRQETWYFFGAAQQVSFDGGATFRQSVEGQRKFDTVAATLVATGMAGKDVKADGTLQMHSNPQAMMDQARNTAAQSGFPLPAGHCFTLMWTVRSGANCSGASVASSAYVDINCGGGYAVNSKCMRAAEAALQQSGRCEDYMYCLQEGPMDIHEVVMIPATKTQPILASTITLPSGSTPPTCPPNCGPIKGGPVKLPDGTLPKPDFGLPGKGGGHDMDSVL